MMRRIDLVQPGSFDQFVEDVRGATPPLAPPGRGSGAARAHIANEITDRRQSPAVRGYHFVAIAIALVLLAFIVLLGG